mgnify:CR=1 FL=1
MKMIEKKKKKIIIHDIYSEIGEIVSEKDQTKTSFYKRNGGASITIRKGPSQSK